MRTGERRGGDRGAREGTPDAVDARPADGATRGPAGPWGTHEVPPGDGLTLAVGPLALRVRRVDEELRVLVRHERDPAEAADTGWTRWAAADVDRVTLSPLFPDRTLVVEPEDPFWLLDGAEARIYLRVPVWLHLEGVGRERHDLLRVPTMDASDTWWGTPEEGELCYWLPTRARRSVGPEHVEPHLVLCPLQLVNRSGDSLHVEKIALRAAYLSLYRSGAALWSDATRVLYTGEAEGSRLEMAGRPPREAEDPELLAPPAELMARGFRARTFRRFRSFTGLFG